MADNVFIKIGTALLKHQVKKLVGEETLGVLSEELADMGGDKLDAWLGDKSTVEQLEKAAIYAHDCFRGNVEDNDLEQWMVMLPLGNLPAVASALEELPTSPDETKLENALRDSIVLNWKSLSSRQVDNAVNSFLSCLRNALLPIEKQTLMVIGRSVLRTEEKLNLLFSLVEQLKPQESSNNPESRLGKIDVRVGGNVDRSTIIMGDNNTVNQYVPVESLPLLLEDILKKTNNNLVKNQPDIDEFEGTEYLEKKRLTHAIDAYIEKLSLQVELARKGYDFDNPYKPLQEYDIRDISLFFGREDATKELLKAINNNKGLTVLHAKSGVGKSSMLKAGLRPQLLANNQLPIYVRPQKYQIEEAIKRALLPKLEQSQVLLHATLHDFLQEITTLLKGKKLVIILDQFEEVFTLQTLEMREQFSRQLALCLDDDLLPINWVISLRAEYLSELATFDPPLSNPISGNMLLQSLTKENAGLAISEPARKMGVEYENGLVELILEELGPQPVHPPELQIVCSALYEASRDNKLITNDLYNSCGKAEGILQEYFNSVMNQKIPRERILLAREVLSTLVNSSGARISRSRDAIEGSLKIQKIDTSFLDEVLERLVDAHLLRIEDTNNSHLSSITYELAHDYLVEKIELDPISQNRKIAQELIEQKTPHYNRNGLLLSPDELALIIPQEKWLNLSGKALELLSESRNNARKLQLRNGIGAIATNIVGVLSVGGAIIYLTSNLVWMFWMCVILFGVIGAMRGWVKELLVAFSVITALAVNLLLEKYIPLFRDLDKASSSIFWIRTLILIALVYFGYQTVSISRFASKAVRERLQDSLFGAVLGGFNGYLVAGTILFYIHMANYPYRDIISPATDTVIVQAIDTMMRYMPPRFLGEPGIYFAVILLLIMIIVTYMDDGSFTEARFSLITKMRKQQQERNKK